MSSSRRRLDSSPSSDRYAHIASNGLRVTKRSSQAVTLAWPENDQDVVTFSESKVSCLDIETELDAQGHWFIVQMRKMDDDASTWNTVYKGYGKRCDVNGLDSDSIIIFRMKRNGDKQWGSEIIASTDPPHASGADLNRAVEMNSEYLVTRILGNTPTSHLKKILISHDKNGMTPLMVACHNGNHTIAKMLLSCGARVNDTSTGVNRTPLMFACITGKLNVAQLLDQHGADWRPKDKGGCNAMHHAINGGNLPIVRFAFAKLAAQNLAFDLDNCGWSPLMRAVILSDNLDIVKFLIGKGANTNEVDRANSKSVLMAAILSRKSSFVKFLLEWGADPFYKNSNGNCFEVARGLGYKEIAAMVRERMEALQPNSPIPPGYTFPSTSKKNIEDNSVHDQFSSSKKNLNLRGSLASTADTNDSNMNIQELPLDKKTKSKDRKKPSERRSRSVVPVHSITSDLETRYLMRPHRQ